ncbi:LMBR1-like membrane protein [Nitzschia inconspicua]|uniref:LMBR1-like membrane protein n=1 Tax=Nitzschia inconspicua TaxID=303405 RepID=A0A9K3KCC1_9STRA|nr:LMBR1-like membrane protein [Nitzschia inconspicua]
MADIFLIVSITVAFLILFVVSVYLLVYYQHPDDHNEAYFPKGVVIFGIMLAGATALLLPLDVANNEGYAGCDGYNTRLCGGLNMQLFWDIFFWLIPIWVFLMIPFSSFYYEADDGMLMAGTVVNPNPVRKSKVWQALGWTAATVLVIGIIFAVSFVIGSDSSIPVNQYTGEDLLLALGGHRTLYSVTPVINETSGEPLPFDPTTQMADMSSADASYAASVTDDGEQTLILQVSLTTFFAGLMAFLGWFLFAVFGGIGMSSMPLDLLLVFKNRPRHMDAVEFAEAQKSLRERVNELVDIGEMIKVERDANPGLGKVGGFGNYFSAEKRKDARNERQALLEFKQAVFLLEQDVDDFKACTQNYDNYNPLKPYICLFLGVCSLIISLFWMIHIIVYMFPKSPWAPFLNNYFEWFDKWFPLFGVLSVAIFTVYLLFAAITGCFKFGLRVACMQLHPMILGKTYMSSFLFNIGLVLMCAMPVVQFSADAFSAYARNSTINQIFNVQIANLNFFGFFFTKNIFVYAFLAFMVLSGLYLMCKPRDAPPSGKELRDRLRSRRG